VMLASVICMEDMDRLVQTAGGGISQSH